MCGPKKSKRLFVQTTQNCPGTIREERTPLGKGGNNMQTQTHAEASKDQQLDEELADTTHSHQRCIQETGPENQGLVCEGTRKKEGGTPNEQDE